MRYGLLGTGSPSNPASEIKLWDRKRNRVLKTALPGPQIMCRNGYGRYKNELWDLVEGKKVADLHDPASGEPWSFTLTHHVAWIQKEGLVLHAFATGKSERLEFDAQLIRFRQTRSESQWLGVNVRRSDGDHLGYLNGETKTITLVKHYPKPDAAKLIGVGLLRGKLFFVVSIWQETRGRNRVDLIYVTPR